MMMSPQKSKAGVFQPRRKNHEENMEKAFHHNGPGLDALPVRTGHVGFRLAGPFPSLSAPRIPCPDNGAAVRILAMGRLSHVPDLL